MRHAMPCRSQTGGRFYLGGQRKRRNGRILAPCPTSEAVSDTRLHSFYLLSGVWQNEAECNPKTRTWATAQLSERWYFINAMEQNPSCSLMTPFREKEPQRWPVLLLITHSVPSILFWRDIITTVHWSQRTCYEHTCCVYSAGPRGNFSAPLSPQQIDSEFPWRQARHGTARTRLFKDANGSRGEAWLEGHILLGDQRHHFPIISLRRGKKKKES